MTYLERRQTKVTAEAVERPLLMERYTARTNRSDRKKERTKRRGIWKEKRKQKSISPGVERKLFFVKCTFGEGELSKTVLENNFCSTLRTLCS